MDTTINTDDGKPCGYFEEAGTHLNMTSNTKEASSPTDHLKMPATKPVTPGITKCIFSKEYFMERTEELVKRVNLKRKNDTKLLTDFKTSLEMQVKKSFSAAEEYMCQMYGKVGKEMDEKLNELFTILERIAKLESELGQFKNALSALYEDAQQSSNF